MGKLCMCSGLIVKLNEPSVQGVRRAIAGRPFVLSAVQLLESLRLCGSLRWLPTYKVVQI